MIDAVVTHHRDPFRSGVARFNELLAEHLGVPLLTFDALDRANQPLLSFKIRELSDPEQAALSTALLAAGTLATYDMFLHEFAGLPLERHAVERARRVYCGNLEIEANIESIARVHETLWAPSLIIDDRAITKPDISVFSFGMAHKVRPDMFGRLRTLLEASDLSYALYVSAANHEAASLKDSSAVFDEMHEIFPDTLFFLGNLSDVAVVNYVRDCTFFAAFFDGGVRANNTSVASAMERGAVTITNLDRYSPPELVHMDNVIDLERCDVLPLDPKVLARISARARETMAPRSWDALVPRLRD